MKTPTAFFHRARVRRAAFVALLAIAGNALAYQAATVQADDMLRKKASARGKVVGQVVKQEKVEVLRCTKGWCLVQGNHATGWMVQSGLWLHEPSAGPGVKPAPTGSGVRTSPGAATFPGMPVFKGEPLQP